MKVDLGVDAQRREGATVGGHGSGLLGRATLGW